MKFNKLDDSTRGKIRPRFKLGTPEKKEDVMQLIFEASKDDESVAATIFSRFIKIRIPIEKRHYWSPVISLSFEQEEDRTLIRAHIGPSEKVWGLFTFFYAAVGILGLFASLWAYMQWTLNNNKQILIVIPVSILILVSIFFTSQFGQKKGSLQMIHLLRFLRKSIDNIKCDRVEE